MTPKEKAKELFNKYYLYIDIKNYENTKECSLIAVNEIIVELLNYGIISDYWQEVKQEIEKL